MNRAGAQEVLLPMVQPAELWKETGRWDFYGKELLRFKDRKDSDFCLGPTHEEVITDLVRHEVRSYRQLPLNLYQVQTKFRDEIRPRFGLMRCREFTMKDAYSFDRDEAGADASYKSMYDAYTRIFRRLGLRFKAVEADSGSIGGSFSHEFMVLADTGEDTIAACTSDVCEYAANLEKAEAVCTMAECGEGCGPCKRVATPGTHTVEEVAAFLGVPTSKIIKTLLFDVDGKAVAGLVRGDRELNEIKLKNALNAQDVKLATPEQVQKWTGAPVGFAGPVGLAVEVVVADQELCNANGMVAGANEGDAHLTDVDMTRDVKVDRFADLRSVATGDLCPRCRTALTLTKGIEVGHVFKLGLKYSTSMNATFLDEDGKERTMVMGCYGIGVSRIIASAIEQNHDADGLMLPPTIAPFEVVLIALAGKDAAVLARAEDMVRELEAAGLDVLFDDRDERPGVKFKDADLIGLPIQLVLGGKGLERGVIEAKCRKTGTKAELPLDGFAEAFAEFRGKVWRAWGL